MAITTAELKLYKSATNDDTTSNGGRMDDSQEVITGVTNNVFPDVSASELSAGLTRWRKVHLRSEDSEDLTLSNIRLYLTALVGGDGEGYITAGTSTDTQNDLSSPNLYGIGTLDSSVSAGASSVDVLVEDGTVTTFRDTEKIRITDGTNTEFHTISGTPSVAGDVVTVSISGTLANAYTAGATTYISSCIEPADVAATVTNASTSTASGTFDDTQITPDHDGAVYENWTVTFTSATNFGVSGDTLGSVGTGNTSSTFAPTNPNTSAPYFTLPAAAWGGTWATSETASFRTNPAATAIWEKLVYPAASSAGSGVSLILGVAANTPT